MRLWEGFAPYNAGQLLTMHEPHQSDPAQAWLDVVAQLRVTHWTLSPVSTRIFHENVASSINQDLNRPWSDDDAPLRPIVANDRELLTLGLTYRHCLADSASVRMLMSAWIDRIVAGPGWSPSMRLVELSESFRLLSARTLREAFAELGRLRRVKRVGRLTDLKLEHLSRWISVDAPDGLINSLRVLARSRGAKVNDLFIAAAARVCSRHVAREINPSRTDVGVGTIVDIRGESRSADDSFAFGLSLGFLQTFFTQDDLQDQNRAVMKAASQSRCARTRRLAHTSQIRLRAALWQHGRLTRSEIAEFYRKRCPLICGISNVNLNGSTLASHHPQHLSSYVRVSPLGPMLPIVFTPTTLGQRLSIGFTYRQGVINDDVANLILSEFVRELVSMQ